MESHRCPSGLLPALLAGCAALFLCLALPGAMAAGEKACAPTAENVEGPYYLPGAPFRERIAPPGASGRQLILTGTVTSADCVTPLAGAVIDLWQTDAEGKYDFSKDFLWRGRVRADEAGRYRFETVIPGQYGAGRSYRPAHIHLRISHPGARTLVTQVYFEDDPYLRDDPFVVPSLVIPLVRGTGGGGEVWTGTFDIILAPGGKR